MLSLQELKALKEKITPGPWKYDGFCYIFCDKNGMIADDGGPDEISVRIRGYGAGLPMDQNAELIALSPSLLSELIELKEWKEEIENELKGFNVANEEDYGFKNGLQYCLDLLNKER